MIVNMRFCWFGDLMRGERLRYNHLDGIAGFFGLHGGRQPYPETCGLHLNCASLGSCGSMVRLGMSFDVQEERDFCG